MKPSRLALGFAALAIHAVLVLAFVLPPRAVFSGAPLASVDYPLHYYHVASEIESERNAGTAAGYDPFFMAGFPQGIYDVEVKPLVLAGRLFPERHLPRIFNLFVFSLVLLPPVLLTAVSALLRMGRDETIALLGLGLFQFFLGWPVDLASNGMVSFLAASYLGLVAWALFHRAAEGDERLRPVAAMGLVALSALATFVHPFFPIVAAPLLASAACALPHGAHRRGLALIGACALGTVVLNLPWLLTILERFDETTPCGVFWQSRSLIAPLIECLPSLNGMKLLAIGLAAAGVWPRARSAPGPGTPLGEPARRALVGLLAAAAALYLFAYYGAFSPAIASLEPMRFLVPFEACLLVPAARGLVRARDAWGPAIARSIRLAAFCFLSIVLLAQSVLFSSHVYWLAVARQRLVRGADAHPSFAVLVDWIRANTSPGERILLEGGGWRRGPEGKVNDYLEALLPLETGRPFLGAPYPWYCLRHGKVSFAGGKLLGRDLASYPDRELAALLERYAVGWVIAWSPKARADLGGRTGRPARAGESAPFLGPAAATGPFAIHRVARPASFFLAGSGAIEFAHGRIRLSGVEPAPDGSVVLKIHCDPRLEGPPGATLKCVDVADDPVGFIEIEGAPRDFELRARGGRG